MEDAASEIGDWEVLSSASSCGGDDSDDVVVVSGGGGDVLPDHFTLDLASPDVGFSGEGSWSEPEVACFKEYQREGLEFLDEFNSISQESLDLVAGISSLQLQEGGADENRESSVLEAAAACGANCSAEGRQAEATGLEIEQENNIARSCGKLDLALPPAHHEAGEPLNSDTTTAIHGSPQSEVAENSSVQLEDHIGVDACIETSRIEDTVSSDGIHGGEADENQGNNAYAGSGCNETDGETKDGALPLVQSPDTGEDGKQVVVWWRLPFKLLHYCAWNVKPVWSFSIAAALLGLVMLGRKMYRMKHKARGMPQIKIAFDDKVSYLLLVFSSSLSALDL
ncbi:hypothetical protein PR202_gb08810 [Eleusine coracana subsp. coracana]|uniref:Uncharacterized protein n=1 Tax=Eleusine coracana subsp. coracana TaxID=191504 RepID=A0AAV5EFL7_ELECO|nr:hypothetical protein PR202_gb08810 [Eleusine coracana subsp. coracana]